MKIELNRILLCGVFATIASSAFAEENPIDWTGSYVGLFAGTYNANTKLTTVESNRSVYPTFGVGDFNSPNIDGSIIGGELGFNHQSGQVVYGVSASLSHSNASSTDWSIDGCCGSSPDDKFTSKMQKMYTAEARIGYSFNRFLISASGGLVSGQYSLTIQDDNIERDGTVHSNSTGRGSDSKFLKGFKTGISIDYALDEKWSVGTDIEWIRLNAENLDATGQSYSFAGTPNGVGTYIMSPQDLKSRIVTINLKYKF